MSIRMGRKVKNNTGLLFSSKDRRTKVYAQPRPTFFSVAEMERMNRQPGSYQYGKGVVK